MEAHPLAGKPPPPQMLTNIPRLVAEYYTRCPDSNDPGQRVSFGTSGHRGSAFQGSFNEAHVAAVAQAVCEYRARRGTQGPLFLGMDTHALSEPAMITVLEVLAANGVRVLYQRGRGYTPTPVISHAILSHNRVGPASPADGIVITPSHNPPADGGIKYNGPDAGPAAAEVTGWIERRANEILEGGSAAVRRLPLAKALGQDHVSSHDFVAPYVADLASAIDLEVVAGAALKIGVDPLGGAGVHFWDPIADHYRLNLEVVNRRVDATFSFMAVDRDGKIRMDCSSPYAMQPLVALKDRFDIAFGNDPDADRHGVVTPGGGLMNPNHYLCVCIEYLLSHRDDWNERVAIGKTLVSSAMIDRVVADRGRALVEVPVGFKWFVAGLLEGTLAFAGEESAGASFLRRDGTVWTTDKDGILLGLLAAEITARTGRDLAESYRRLCDSHGTPVYERVDAPATRDEKAALKELSTERVTTDTLAGDRITAKLTHAPGNGASLGGLKVATEQGWFAARPSGTEDVYKIYAESFRGEEHLRRIQHEAQELVAAALK